VYLGTAGMRDETPQIGIFRYGVIEDHGPFVNLQLNRVQPLAIDSEIMEAMRPRGRNPLNK
jgi:hypothetical protein